MSLPRLVFLSLTLVLVIVCLGLLFGARARDSRLGLWDSGRFSAQVMPEPGRIPDEQLARLGLHRRISFQPGPEVRPGESLEELFKWYDLDARYVDATVNAGRLDPTHVPADSFDVTLINEK